MSRVSRSHWDSVILDRELELERVRRIYDLRMSGSKVCRRGKSQHALGTLPNARVGCESPKGRHDTCRWRIGRRRRELSLGGVDICSHGSREQHIPPGEGREVSNGIARLFAWGNYVLGQESCMRLPHPLHFQPLPVLDASCP